MDGMTQDEKKSFFLLALREVGGNVSKACEAAQMSRQTFYNWMNDDEKFSLAVKEIQFHVTEELLDMAEETVKFWLTAKMDKDTAKWLLARLGRARGYGNKVEMEHTGNAFKGLEYPEEPKSMDDWAGKKDEPT